MVIVTMAYRTQTSAGSVFACLDDVPFVISDRFKPPPKVTLPMKFELGNPSEILFMEYDTSLEEKVVAECKAAFDARSAAQAASQERAKVVAKAEEMASAGSREPEVHHPTLLPAGGSRPPYEPSGAVYQLSNGNDILVPTPIAAQLSRGNTNVSGSQLYNIDIRDFEREQDPFENLSLRVMNDREELNKVFRVVEPTAHLLTTQPQRSDGRIVEQPAHLPPTEQQRSDSPAVERKPPPSANDKQSSALLQYVGSNGIGSVGNSGLNFVPCQHVSQWPDGGCNGLPGSTMPQGPLPATGAYGIAQYPPSEKLTSDSVGFSSGYGVSFKPPVPTAQSVCYSTLLRSAKSTPDISSLTDETVPNMPRRTPPPFSHVEPSSLWMSGHTPPPHTEPSSWTAAKKTENCLSDRVQAGVNSSSSSVVTPGVFETLSSEARQFVTSLMAMGFDQDDVAQTVKRLGTDDKLVLDHLCVLGQLKDKGYSSCDASAALLLFDDDTEKAEAYLKLSKSFHELGFPRDRIKDALVSTDLDADKSLDLLVGS